jgi:hypothetical protein
MLHICLAQTKSMIPAPLRLQLPLAIEPSTAATWRPLKHHRTIWKSRAYEPICNNQFANNAVEINLRTLCLPPSTSRLARLVDPLMHGQIEEMSSVLKCAHLAHHYEKKRHEEGRNLKSNYRHASLRGVSVDIK